MVTTVTLNPAIDNIVVLDSFSPNTLNRAKEEYLFAGGKGVNVSLALTRLGVPNRATGFLAGATGLAYRALLRDGGICDEFLALPNGSTRINTKISAAQETEINGAGPLVTQAHLQMLCDTVGTLGSGDYLVLSGNVPAGIPQGYPYLAKRLLGSGARLVVDTSGPALEEMLDYGPFLVKPNVQELSQLLGVTIDSRPSLYAAAGQLQRAGARNVLVSMGRDGAYLLAESGKRFLAAGIAGNSCNAVGAGDSMVAGFLRGWLPTNDPAEALRWAVAAGTASAFSFGIAQADTMVRYLPSVRLRELGSGNEDGEISEASAGGIT